MCGVAPNAAKMNQMRAPPLQDMSTSAKSLASAASVTRAVVSDLLPPATYERLTRGISIRSSQLEAAFLNFKPKNRGFNAVRCLPKLDKFYVCLRFSNLRPYLVSV